MREDTKNTIAGVLLVGFLVIAPGVIAGTIVNGRAQGAGGGTGGTVIISTNTIVEAETFTATNMFVRGGWYYLEGNEFTDGSWRFGYVASNDTAQIQYRSNGVWRLSSEHTKQ